MRSVRTSWMVATGLAVLPGVALGSPPFAETAPGGDALVVPADEAQRGTVYHALPGGGPQVVFESDAPLETIRGRSDRVIGYVVASPGSESDLLVAGEWRLPVESMSTGIPLRDEHLAGPDWLDAASHPGIVFELEGVRDTALTRRSDAYETYEVTLVGDMTIHGVTNAVEIPGARVTFLSESDATRRIAEGDLLAIRAEHSVSLFDYGVGHEAIGQKVADEVRISTTLYMSTVPPSER